MNSLNESFIISPILKVEYTNGILYNLINIDMRSYEFNKDNESVINYTSIIEFMMKPFKSYFDNIVGWKDQNGNIIKNNQIMNHCNDYDPAL